MQCGDIISTYLFHRKNAIKNLDSKLNIVLSYDKSWPRYVTYEEDMLFQKQKLTEKYREQRMVIWDDTNISFAYKPLRTLNQQITYSSYYFKNCAKGGVFL